jgi:hypothetical protein
LQSGRAVETDQKLPIRAVEPLVATGAGSDQHVVQTGEFDLLRDERTHRHKRLRRIGGRVRLEDGEREGADNRIGRGSKTRRVCDGGNAFACEDIGSKVVRIFAEASCRGVATRCRHRVAPGIEVDVQSLLGAIGCKYCVSPASRIQRVLEHVDLDIALRIGIPRADDDGEHAVLYRVVLLLARGVQASNALRATHWGKGEAEFAGDALRRDRGAYGGRGIEDIGAPTAFGRCADVPDLRPAVRVFQPDPEHVNVGCRIGVAARQPDVLSTDAGHAELQEIAGRGDVDGGPHEIR